MRYSAPTPGFVSVVNYTRCTVCILCIVETEGSVEVHHALTTFTVKAEELVVRAQYGGEKI